MATRLLRVEERLETNTKDVGMWFEKFNYYLIEKELIIPTPADPDQVTDIEQEAIKKMKKRQVVHLINNMSSEMFSRLKNLMAPKEIGEESLETIQAALEQHASPKPTVLTERHKFHWLRQKDGEETGVFFSRLREQALKCCFDADQLDERIRDQFVFGIKSVDARETLLSEDIDKLEIKTVFEKVIAIERSKKEAQAQNPDVDLNWVDRGKYQRRKQQREMNPETQERMKKIKCYLCKQYGHMKINCPQKRRNSMDSRSPMGIRSLSGSKEPRSRRHHGKDIKFKRTMNQVILDDQEGESYSIDDLDQFQILNLGIELDKFHINLNLNEKSKLFEKPLNVLHDKSAYCADFNAEIESSDMNLHTISDCSESVKAVCSKPLIYVKVNDGELAMEVDSGASVTVCSESAMKLAGIKYSVLDCSAKLTVANGQKLDVVGKAVVDVHVNGLYKPGLELYLVQGSFPTLFGRSWIKEFCGDDWLNKLLPNVKSKKTPGSSVVSVIKVEKPEQVMKPESQQIRSVEQLLKSPVFEDGLGLVRGVKIRLKLRDGASPKSEPPRRVPFAVKQKLEMEYKKLIEQGVLIDIKDSPWGTPVVPVAKGDSVRVCGDYTRTLNQVLDLKHYPLPTIEECFSKVAGGEKFSKIDVRQAFNNLEIAEEHREFTTLNTHLGQKAWTRVPYGLNNSGAYFQEAIDKILSGIPMVCCRVDDILVSGRNDKDHLANLNEVFSRLETHGLRVKKEKTELMRDELIYLGHRISKHGMSPVRSKVEDLLKTPEPENVKQLIAFLGAVGYYRRYLPDLATVIAPLDCLRSSKVKWQWTKVEQDAFKKLKELLSSDRVVACYDPEMAVKVESDASKVGLGAVISHVYPDGSEKVIEYASRTLSECEKKYSQIDKEALGIIWAVKRFHYYLYGRESFDLVTDHQPLTFIFNKNRGLPEMSSNRVSRWALILMNYNYKIRYRRSQDHANCDMLSRLPRPGVIKNPVDEDAEAFSIDMDQAQLDAVVIASETRKDPILSKVSMWILDGFPKVKPCDLNPELSAYWNRSDTLSIELDCITWGNRVIIPNKLRTKVLELIHASHIGVGGMKSVARSFVYWPGLDRDIEQVAQMCPACNKYGKSLPSNPDHPWIRSTRPFQRVHVDFADFGGRKWFLLYDSYSKWPEITGMDRTKTEDTIKVLRDIFCRFGIPFTLVSDGGPQFISEEFERFMRVNQIRHIKSPTYSPRSNGFCEVLVRIWKASMKKSLETSPDLDLNSARFLLSYRNTPHSTTGVAPAVRMFNRTLRSRLHQLRPSDRQIMEDLQPEREEKLMDNKLKERNFFESEPVWAQINDNKIWYPAQIVKTYPGSPVYDIAYNGRVIKKHVERIKRRLTPVIDLQKQSLNEAERQKLAAAKFASEERAKEEKLRAYLERKQLKYPGANDNTDMLTSKTSHSSTEQATVSSQNVPTVNSQKVPSTADTAVSCQNLPTASAAGTSGSTEPIRRSRRLMGKVTDFKKFF